MQNVCYSFVTLRRFTNVVSRLLLKYEPDIDFVLIAITSSLRDYRLCFRINLELNVDFARISELSLDLNASREPAYFTRYYYQQPGQEASFFLISNKGTEGYLIPEMKSTDYFILVKNLIDEEDLDIFTDGLNRLPDVVVAVQVDPSRLKSKENLIFYTNE